MFIAQGHSVEVWNVRQTLAPGHRLINKACMSQIVGGPNVPLKN